MPEVNVWERSSLQLPITDAASLGPDQVLERLASAPEGLTDEEAARRLADVLVVKEDIAGCVVADGERV
jgi:Mg2+-importing ATPase